MSDAISFYKDHFFETICVGGGTTALAAAARLCEDRPGALFTEDEHQRFHWLKKRGKQVSIINDKKQKTPYTLTTRLSPSEILVLDAVADSFMGQWNRQFAACQIPYLRLPMFFHPDPANVDGMVSYAHFSKREGPKDLMEITNVVGREILKHQRKKNASKTSKGSHNRSGLVDVNMRDWKDYYRPSTPFFKDFCVSLVERYGLQDVVRKDEVVDVAYRRVLVVETGESGWGFVVRTETGKVYGCKTCIVASGHRGEINYPIGVFREKSETEELMKEKREEAANGVLEEGTAGSCKKADVISSEEKIKNTGKKMDPEEATIVSSEEGSIHSSEEKSLFSLEGRSIDSSEENGVNSCGENTMELAAESDELPDVFSTFMSSSANPGLSASCHTTHIFSGEALFPPPVPSQKTLVIVGGGLTLAQLAHVAAKAGIKVVFLLRGPLKVKHFDFHLDWVTKYRNVKKLAFFIRDTDEERFDMIQEARQGGSVNPEYHKKILSHVKAGEVELMRYTTIVGQKWDDTMSEWSLRLKTAEPERKSYFRTLSKASYIVFATGITAKLPSLPFLQTMLKEHPLQTVCGFPCLSDDLLWNELPLYMTGKNASLRLGPAAANLDGARVGAERIGWKIHDDRARGKYDWRPRHSFGSENEAETADLERRLSEASGMSEESVEDIRLRLAEGLMSWFELLGEE